LTLEQFRESIANGNATPGGGAVAAVTVALAASLLRMCFSITRKTQDSADLQAYIVQVREAQDIADQCGDADVSAYNSYIAAIRLPKATEEQSDNRDAARIQALIECTSVPLRCAGSALLLLNIALASIDLVSQHVLSDFGTAISHLHAALRSLLFTIETNLGNLPVGPAEETLFDRHHQLSVDIYAAERRVEAALESITQRIGTGQ
jgi:formiminotetrahydrofolate cyclodeaminase